MSRAARVRKACPMRIMVRHIAGLAALALLSACEQAPRALEGPAAPLALPPPPKVRAEGLEQVMGHNATVLIALLGKPVQDQREANGRRLQFIGAGCVFDAYLYPPQAGREPVVTYTEARWPDGRDADRAACLTAQLRARGR